MRSNSVFIHSRGGGVRRTRSRGFSFMELLVVLVVVGSLAGFVISESDVALFRGSVEEEARAIQSIQTAIQQAYGSKNVYSGLNNDAIYTSVADVVHGPSRPQLGHEWDPTGYSVGTRNSDQQYTVTMSNIPRQPCEEVAKRFLDAFRSVEVNGTTVTNPGDVASNCQDNSTNEVIFVGN